MTPLSLVKSLRSKSFKEGEDADSWLVGEIEKLVAEHKDRAASSPAKGRDMKVASIYREHSLCLARIAELEQALEEIRAKAKFEQQHPTGLHMTCLSLIEKTATLALAGVDTYEMESAAPPKEETP